MLFAVNREIAMIEMIVIIKVMSVEGMVSVIKVTVNFTMWMVLVVEGLTMLMVVLIELEVVSERTLVQSVIVLIMVLHLKIRFYCKRLSLFRRFRFHFRLLAMQS